MAARTSKSARALGSLGAHLRELLQVDSLEAVVPAVRQLVLSSSAHARPPPPVVMATRRPVVTAMPVH